MSSARNDVSCRNRLLRFQQQHHRAEKQNLFMFFKCHVKTLKMPKFFFISFDIIKERLMSFISFFLPFIRRKIIVRAYFYSQIVQLLASFLNACMRHLFGLRATTIFADASSILFARFRFGFAHTSFFESPKMLIACLQHVLC